MQSNINVIRGPKIQDYDRVQVKSPENRSKKTRPVQVPNTESRSPPDIQEFNHGFPRSRREPNGPGHQFFRPARFLVSPTRSPSLSRSPTTHLPSPVTQNSPP
jgi:hypothetical protein